MEGERETIIFWTPEQRGKDLNVSGWSYDKHREAGDRARIPGAGKSSIHHAQRARAYLKLIRGGEVPVTVKVRGQGAAVVHPAHARVHAWTA